MMRMPMPVTAMVMKVMILATCASLARADGGRSAYAFREMSCSGALLPGETLTESFRFVELRIVYDPFTFTDVLGQTRTRDLKWYYAFGRSAGEARADLGEDFRMGSNPLSQRVEEGRRIVSFGDMLRVEVSASDGASERLIGSYFSAGAEYGIDCVAEK